MTKRHRCEGVRRRRCVHPAVPGHARCESCEAEFQRRRAAVLGSGRS